MVRDTGNLPGGAGAVRYALPIEVEQGWLALALVILEGTTPLPKAACRGLAPKFDVERGRGQRSIDVSAAVAICRTCPDRTPCELWGRDAPAGTVSGVLGNVIRWPPSAR